MHEHLDALPILESLCDEEPENVLYALQLATSQLQLGLLEEARATLDIVLEERPDTALAHLCLSKIAYRSGHYEESLRHADTAVAVGRPHATLFNQLGLAHARVRNWDVAIAAFARALDCDPQNHLALLGRARCLLGQRDFASAAEVALDAIGRDYQNPLGHYVLGLALLRQGLTLEAEHSLEVAAALAPGVARIQAHLLRIKRVRGASATVLETQRAALHQAQGKRAAASRIRAAARRREHGLSHEISEASLADWLNASPAVEPVAPRVPMNHLIVTGLPCAGVSTVSRMLKAGGLPLYALPYTAEKANPTGLALSQLLRDSHKLAAAQGHVIRVPALLLGQLPSLHHYKVVYVGRNIDDLVRSQNTRVASELSFATCARMLRRHRDDVLVQIRQAPNFDVVEIDFDALCENPGEVVTQCVADFTGRDLDVARMIAAIEPARRRFRTNGVNSAATV
jgi:tetratricopeptide (TPR) repeat protein